MYSTTYKEQALKLAKRMGVPLTDLDTNDWKGSLQALKAENQYNKIMDQLEQQLPKIQHERVMGGVIAELTGKDQIQLDISLQTADPPTIDDQQTTNLTVNLDDYTIAFAFTQTEQILDEFGDLEKEVTSKTAFKPIQAQHFNKHVGTKRAATALIGFLNNYMEKMTKSLTFVKKVHVKLTKKIKAPRRLTPNFDGLKLNCVTDMFSNLLKTRANFKKNLEPRLLELNEKYFNQGVGEEAIEEICHAVRVN